MSSYDSMYVKVIQDHFHDTTSKSHFECITKPSESILGRRQLKRTEETGFHTKNLGEAHEVMV